MPITVAPGLPGGLIGPGVQVGLHSDFVGPIPTGSRWRLRVFGDPLHESLALLTDFTAPSGGPTSVVLQVNNDLVSAPSTYIPAEGEDVRLTVQLLDPTSVPIDTGQVDGPWTLHGLGNQADLIGQKQSQTGGGLTAEQARQLSDTTDSSVPSVSTDELGLLNLRPGPPSGDFIGYNATTPIFGVIVRIASVPDGLLPETPDEDYWVKTLAVVRVYRGSDLWIRAPIHTSSKIVNMEGEGVVNSFAKAFTNLTLLDLSVQVTFLPGVTGTAFAMLWP